MNKKVPVLFVIFNRPDTTERVFAAIRQYQPDKLYIAADGPREGKENEVQLCATTRDIIKKIDWDCELKTLFKDKNVGCGLGVSSAITWFFENEEYGIILEDDCMPSLSFFPYCEELLIKYKSDEEIMMIGGNNFQNGIEIGEGSYYFSKYPHIWGWASWSRAWNKYQYKITDVESFFNNESDPLFIDATENNFWKKLLIKVQKGEINTWDYQWTYSIWKNHGFAITPNANLVINLGFRNSSTHDFLKDSYREITEFTEIKFPLIHPSKVINEIADRNTFNNVVGKNLKRVFRIFRQNSLSTLFRYAIKKY